MRNRIAVSPMCQYSADEGFADDWHLVHLGSRAIGGAGLVLLEASAVSPEGRISEDDLGIWSDDHIPMLERITSFLHEHGAASGIQLAHAGRKASTSAPWKGGKSIKEQDGGWKTLAPSALPFHEGDDAPLALDQAGIDKIKSDFKSAAKRALKAGFQIIELHAAHGYLLHQFLSPLSNLRNDEYGGSFENRTRLLLEIISSVQETWPAENPLFVRISATDWVEGGWSPEESVLLSGILKVQGVDLIDCSSGGLSPAQKIPVFAGYQVPFSEAVKTQTGILTAAVGLITEAKQAEEIIHEGKADLVLLARELLRDPYFPLHAAAELGADVKWPVQYERAKPRK